MGGGLHGYISMNVSPPSNGFGYGVSFYASVWPLLASPLKSFQIGLPGTWIMPDNQDYQKPLCPHGTLARDHWYKRAPSYREVFQTIEGGLGFWTSTQFPSATAKYIMNGTPNCYNYMIETPGWGFDQQPSHLLALDSKAMGLAQISNRLVVPPDGWTFKQGMHGELFGTAWMALPLMDPTIVNHRQITGDLSWTLFVNALNFKGPVAYWLPSTWSQISLGYPTDEGRTLDARQGVMAGGAMEVNTVPYFSNTDRHGVLYTRIPQILFPVDASHTTVLMQDVQMYSRNALYNSIKSWWTSSSSVTGAFNPKGAITPSCTSKPLQFDQHSVPMTGFAAFVQTTMVGRHGTCSYGLKWMGSAPGFPQYFKQDGKQMVAIPASQVPQETGLAAQTFEPAVVGKPYTSPTGPETAWTTPGPSSGPYTAVLTDGSMVTYYWYRFVDQPALQHLHLSNAEKAQLQSRIERIQKNWPINRNYMPPPDSGSLATLDSAIIVTPPKGLELGYVPIVTLQEPAPYANR
ncbi:MAG: hypothetical protein ACP5E5_14340 [Acidobacteriaceae bacterium]